MANEKDNFRASYADPELIEIPNFNSLHSSLPFDSQPANIQDMDISLVPPLAGIVQPGSGVQQVQNVETDLAILRAELPWLPILKFPQAIGTVFLATANLAQDLIIPTGAVVVRFFSGFDYYVSLGGRAVVPTAALFPVNGDAFSGASIYKPDNWFYCGGVKSCSLVAPAANAIVTAVFINRPSPEMN